MSVGAVFKALASSHRRRILEILGTCDEGEGKSCCAQNEVCACKISEALGLSASTTSHHMSVLKEAGLVSARREGTWTHYALQRDALARAARELERLQGPPAPLAGVGVSMREETA